MSVGLAILGGGIFVQEAHLPALKEVGPSAVLKAIYSRSQKSAKASVDVAEKLSLGTPDLYYDGDKSHDLSALLARKDIQGIIIALPIPQQPEIIIECLKAGKHVLAEKPVAKDVATGLELIKTYESEYKPKGLIFRVAENWEVEPAFLIAKQAIADGKIGKVQTFHLSAIQFVDNIGNKWYDTPWRTKPEYQGGFLLDGGVHSAAMLRTILPSPVVALSGFAALNNEHLWPNDAIHAVLQCADGSQGTFVLDVGARGFEGPAAPTTIIGSNGSIEFGKETVDGTQHNKVTIKTGKKGSQTTEVKIAPSCGVQKEQEYFIDAISAKTDNDYGNPRGALRDVAVIQGGLTSNGHLVEFSRLMPGI